MPRDTSEMFHFAAALAACLVAAGLYRLFGFIGVGLTGLLILSAATRLELSDGESIGSARFPNLYAQDVMNDQGLSRSERAARLGERRRSRRAIRYAQMLGLALLVVGAGGFLLVDLHLWR